MGQSVQLNGNPEDEEPPLFVIVRLFPRIASAIELMWGHRELEEYLHGLIMADRGDRAGFPDEVLAALLKLHNQHAAQFKFQRKSEARDDPWAQEDRINRLKSGPPGS